jgi:hypothetical protein
MNEASCRKRILFHLLLASAVAVDIPMYVSFVVLGDYSVVTYSFHKFESALLFMAYSVTIFDWTAVLRDIGEIELRPLFFRRNFLIGVNVLMVVMSTINFVVMHALKDLDSYLNSPVYIAGIWLQIVAAFLLTGMMLSSGIRLSVRIRGVCGELGVGLTGNKAQMALYPETRHARGLQAAVRRLNNVMLVCFVCVGVQVLLLILNYALGYARQTDKTVGPKLFYWTFYFWLPLWGPIISLMYLNRTGLNRREGQTGDNVSPMYGYGYGNGKAVSSSSNPVHGTHSTGSRVASASTGGLGGGIGKSGGGFVVGGSGRGAHGGSGGEAGSSKGSTGLEARSALVSAMSRSGEVDNASYYRDTGRAGGHPGNDRGGGSVSDSGDVEGGEGGRKSMGGGGVGAYAGGRGTGYRPPDYSSNLFSRDSAYRLEDEEDEMGHVTAENSREVMSDDGQTQTSSFEGYGQRGGYYAFDDSTPLHTPSTSSEAYGADRGVGDSGSQNLHDYYGSYVSSPIFGHGGVRSGFSDDNQEAARRIFPRFLSQGTSVHSDGSFED